MKVGAEILQDKVAISWHTQQTIEEKRIWWVEKNDGYEGFIQHELGGVL